MSTLGCRLSIIKAFENSFVIGLAATLVLPDRALCLRKERYGGPACHLWGPRTWKLEEANLELKLKRCTRWRDATVPARERSCQKEGVEVDATEKNSILRIPMASRYS